MSQEGLATFFAVVNVVHVLETDGILRLIVLVA